MRRVTSFCILVASILLLLHGARSEHAFCQNAREIPNLVEHDAYKNSKPENPDTQNLIHEDKGQNREQKKQETPKDTTDFMNEQPQESKSQMNDLTRQRRIQNNRSSTIRFSYATTQSRRNLRSHRQGIRSRTANNREKQQHRLATRQNKVYSQNSRIESMKVNSERRINAMRTSFHSHRFSKTRISRERHQNRQTFRKRQERRENSQTRTKAVINTGARLNTRRSTQLRDNRRNGFRLRRENNQRSVSRRILRQRRELRQRKDQTFTRQRRLSMYRTREIRRDGRSSRDTRFTNLYRRVEERQIRMRRTPAAHRVRIEKEYISDNENPMAVRKHNVNHNSRSRRRIDKRNGNTQLSRNSHRRIQTRRSNVYRNDIISTPTTSIRNRIDRQNRNERLSNTQTRRLENHFRRSRTSQQRNQSEQKDNKVRFSKQTSTSIREQSGEGQRKRIVSLRSRRQRRVNTRDARNVERHISSERRYHRRETRMSKNRQHRTGQENMQQRRYRLEQRNMQGKRYRLEQRNMQRRRYRLDQRSVRQRRFQREQLNMRQRRYRLEQRHMRPKQYSFEPQNMQQRRYRLEQRNARQNKFRLEQRNTRQNRFRREQLNIRQRRYRLEQRNMRQRQHSLEPQNMQQRRHRLEQRDARENKFRLQQRNTRQRTFRREQLNMRQRRYRLQQRNMRQRQYRVGQWNMQQRRYLIEQQNTRGRRYREQRNVRQRQLNDNRIHRDTAIFRITTRQNRRYSRNRDQNISSSSSNNIKLYTNPKFQENSVEKNDNVNLISSSNLSSRKARYSRSRRHTDAREINSNALGHEFKETAHNHFANFRKSSRLPRRAVRNNRRTQRNIVYEGNSDNVYRLIPKINAETRRNRRDMKRNSNVRHSRLGRQQRNRRMVEDMDVNDWKNTEREQIQQQKTVMRHRINGIRSRRTTRFADFHVDNINQEGGVSFKPNSSLGRARRSRQRRMRRSVTLSGKGQDSSQNQLQITSKQTRFYTERHYRSSRRQIAHPLEKKLIIDLSMNKGKWSQRIRDMETQGYKNLNNIIGLDLEETNDRSVSGMFLRKQYGTNEDERSFSFADISSGVLFGVIGLLGTRMRQSGRV